MIIIQICVPLLIIVLIKGAEVGRVYAFNHPPFDDNDDIPVAVEHNHEVRKAKSVTFSDNPTTFHPTFKTPDNEDVTADIPTVNSEFYKSYRVIPGDYNEGQIPVKIVYDKSEVVNSNERRRLVQQRGKPIEDKELRTAGERKIVYQTIRRKKIHDGGVRRTVQENTTPAIWTTQEKFNTKIAVPHVKVLPRRGSVKNSNQNQNQPITPSVVSTSGQTIQPENTVKEVNLLSQGSLESDKDGIYATKNYNESGKKSAQAISDKTKTFIGRGTELYASTQRSSRNRMNQMMNNGPAVRDENKTIVSKRDAVEKHRLYERSHSRVKRPIVPIVESESFIYAHNGDFHYSYEGADGTKAFEKGQLKYDTNQNSHQKKQGEAVEGGFSYTDAEGKDYSLTYTADENGYRPMGAHLPTPPPIPPAIARALQYLATKPTPVDDEVTKSWW